MVTTGAVVSGAIVQTNVRDADSVPSDTVAVTEYEPAAVGMPAIAPVDTVSDNPGGRPVAEYESGSPFASVPTSWSDAACPMFADWFAIGASTGATLNVTVNTSVETLPAESRAVTVTLLRPLCSAIAPVFQVVVPAAIPLPPRSFAQVTCVTPTPSLAEPLTVTEDEVVVNVAADVGLVIVTTGAVVSNATIVQLNERDAVSAPSDTVAVTK